MGPDGVISGLLVNKSLNCQSQSKAFEMYSLLLPFKWLPLCEKVQSAITPTRNRLRVVAHFTFGASLACQDSLPAGRAETQEWCLKVKTL